MLIRTWLVSGQTWEQAVTVIDEIRQWEHPSLLLCPSLTSRMTIS